MRNCRFCVRFRKYHSILGGIGAVIFGLPLSAIIVFSAIHVFGRKDHDQADDSHGQQ